MLMMGEKNGLICNPFLRTNPWRITIPRDFRLSDGDLDAFVAR